MQENIVNFKEISDKEIQKPRDDIIYLEEITESKNIELKKRKVMHEQDQMEGDHDMTGLRKARIDYYSKKLKDMEANYTQTKNSRNE